MISFGKIKDVRMFQWKLMEDSGAHPWEVLASQKDFPYEQL